MSEWSLLAILVLICSVIGGSTAGGLLVSWKIHRRLLALEFASAEQDRILLREVKKRAAEERWTKQGDVEKLAQMLQSQKNVGPDW